MSRLLLAYEREIVTVTLLINGLSELSNEYGFQLKTKQLLHISKADIDGTDIIILIRPSDVWSPVVANYAKKAGVLVITYCDDDLLSLTDNPPLVSWRKKGLEETLAFSDVIMSSSPFILEKYRKLTNGGRTALINTIVDKKEFNNTYDEGERKGIKVVYAAGVGHESLFQEFICPILPSLGKKYKGRVSLTFVGVHPDIEDLDILQKLSVSYVDPMPLNQYRTFMAEQHFDIGLAPLCSDEFSKCKYYNKYIEYTLSGIVGVYSKTEPYTCVVKNGENGYLAQPNEWFQVLSCAIDNYGNKKQIIKKAKDFLLENNSKDGIWKQLVIDIPELVFYGGKRIPCSQLPIPVRYCWFRLCDVFFLTRFYLRKLGIMGFMEKVKRHFVWMKACK